jgi:hypothetical protein
VTVEHDGCDGRPGDDRPDPLLAVLTGEPLPGDADPAHLAEYRAAADDVALLKRQLTLLGDALAEPPAAAARPAAPPPRRAARRPRPVRVRSLALGAVGVAAAGAMVSGLGWLAVQAGSASNVTSSADEAGGERADAEAKDAGALAAPGYLACARLVAEGEVAAVEPVPGTRKERVTLRITRSYVPDVPDGNRAGETVFVIARAAGLDEGEHVLVALPHGSRTPDAVHVGERDVARQRRILENALPYAGTCE